MSTAGRLKSWLQDRKDSSVSMVLEKMLQKKIARYGRLLQFRIDSARSSASVEVLLHGEAHPLAVQIERYELSHRQQTSYVTVHQATTSRQWLNSLLEDAILGRPFPIPEQYASYAKMIL